MPGNPGGGPIAPAGPQPPSPKELKLTMATLQIIEGARVIASEVPEAAPTAREINRLVQELQMKIIQSQPPTEVAAPPV